MAFETFIFDVDGTLASTNELIFATFNHVAQKYIDRKLSDDEIISLFGPTEDVILQEWIKDNYDAARKDYFKFYTEKHKIMADIYPGIKEILEDIKSAGKNLAIFTGKGRTSTEITLNEIGVFDYFDFIVSGDDVENHKPSSEGIEKILKKLNSPKEKTLMIGDAVSDIKASRDAGVKIASVVWDSYAKNEVINSNQDYIFYTVDELKNFVNSNLTAD